MLSVREEDCRESNEPSENPEYIPEVAYERAPMLRAPRRRTAAEHRLHLDRRHAVLISLRSVADWHRHSKGQGYLYFGTGDGIGLWDFWQVAAEITLNAPLMPKPERLAIRDHTIGRNRREQ